MENNNGYLITTSSTMTTTATTFGKATISNYLQNGQTVNNNNHYFDNNNQIEIITKEQEIIEYDESIPLHKSDLYVMDKNNDIVPLAKIREILIDETLKHNINGIKILDKLDYEQSLNLSNEIGGTTLLEKDMNEFTRIICDYLIVIFSEYPLPEHFELFAKMIVDEYPRLGPMDFWFWGTDNKIGLLKYGGKLPTRLKNQRKPNTYRRRRLRCIGPDGKLLNNEYSSARPLKVGLKLFNSQGQQIIIKSIKITEQTNNNNNNNNLSLSTKFNPKIIINDNNNDNNNNNKLNQSNKLQQQMNHHNNLNKQQQQHNLRNQSKLLTSTPTTTTTNDNDNEIKNIPLMSKTTIINDACTDDIETNDYNDDDNNEDGGDWEIMNENKKQQPQQKNRINQQQKFSNNNKRHHQHNDNVEKFQTTDKSLEIHIKRPSRNDSDNDNDDDDDDDVDDDYCENCGTTRKKSNNKRRRNRGGGFKIVVYCYPLDD